jgi:hypothetical protein
MSPSFIRVNYVSNTMGVLEGARTTYHSQSPRLLLLMSPSFFRVKYISNTMGVLVEAGTTFHSQHYY